MRKKQKLTPKYRTGKRFQQNMSEHSRKINVPNSHDVKIHGAWSELELVANKHSASLKLSKVEFSIYRQTFMASAQSTRKK